MSDTIKSYIFMGNGLSEENEETKPKKTGEEMGLERCKKCGEYYGNIVDDSEELEVECICNGIVCRNCGITKIHRPISNYFDETDGKIWHVPYFGYICHECRKIK